MKQKKYLTSLILISFFTFTFSSAQTTTLATSTISTTSLDICTAINSLTPYNYTNIKKLQNYIRQNFFGKTKVTGIFDAQTKYYVKQFQTVYGLEATGNLNPETIMFFKNKNNCFDLEKKILNLQSATKTTATKTISIASGTLMGVVAIWGDRKTQQEIINELLNFLK